MKPKFFFFTIFILGVMLVGGTAVEGVTTDSFAVRQSNKNDKNLPTLELGKTLDVKVVPGTSHEYKLSLNANTYFHIAVKQRGIDVAIKLTKYSVN